MKHVARMLFIETEVRFQSLALQTSTNTQNFEIGENVVTAKCATDLAVSDLNTKDCLTNKHCHNAYRRHSKLKPLYTLRVNVNQ